MLKRFQPPSGETIFAIGPMHIPNKLKVKQPLTRFLQDDPGEHNKSPFALDHSQPSKKIH